MGVCVYFVCVYVLTYLCSAPLLCSFLLCRKEERQSQKHSRPAVLQEQGQQVLIQVLIFMEIYHIYFIQTIGSYARVFEISL